jgi:hypothetical protein
MLLTDPSKHGQAHKRWTCRKTHSAGLPRFLESMGLKVGVLTYILQLVVVMYPGPMALALIPVRRHHMLSMDRCGR